MEKFAVNFGDKIIKFSFEDFNEEIDLDEILKIDYSNLIAELVTFPVVVNKIGILRAEIENKLRVEKMNFKIRESKLKNQTRERLLEDNEKKPTIPEVEDALIVNKI